MKQEEQSNVKRPLDMEHANTEQRKEHTMATTYIVEGHLGGMYISQSSPDDIEWPCSSCGDSDIIVGEFDSADENDVAQALVTAFRDSIAWYDFYIRGEDDANDENVKRVHEEIDDMFDDESIDCFLDMLDAKFYDFSGLSYKDKDYAAKRRAILETQTPDRPITDGVRVHVREQLHEMGRKYHETFAKDLERWNKRHKQAR